MTDSFGAPEHPLEPLSLGSALALNNAQDAMTRAAREVMAIQDVTTGDKNSPIRIRGQLTLPAEQAFKRLRPQFEAVGNTPTLRHEDGLDVIRALPTVFERPTAIQYRVPLLLFLATVVTVFLTGMGQTDGLYIGPMQAILYFLTHNRSIVPDPSLLPSPEVFRQALITGLEYMAAMLGILGTHEMGHYLVARYHKVHTTPPYFIPLPPGISILGTLGAVIAMREPAPNRRIQFDIGIAGPLAGIIVAIPIMFLGISLSRVATEQQFIAGLPAAMKADGFVPVLHEGQSLLYLAIKYLVKGQILPQGDSDVWLHSVAFAAWAGFLVTALHLLQVGQLDGGHILYGLLGHNAQKARGPVLAVIITLAIMGTIRELVVTAPPGSLPIPPNLMPILTHLPGWSGWWIWVLFIMFLLRGHAPVLDEITGLDTKRVVLGVTMLVIFLLIFMPTPITIEQIKVAMLH